MRNRLYPVMMALAFFSGCAGTTERQPGTPEAGFFPSAGRRHARGSCSTARLPERERLVYQVRWMGIPVGMLVSEISGVKTYKGRNVYVLEASFKSNFFLSKLYRIDDRFVSYMDCEKLCSLRHEAYRTEGRHKKRLITEFDQVNHRAVFRDLDDKTVKEFSIPPNVQDTLSATYYFRFFPLCVGSRIEYAVANNEKNYELFIVAEARVRMRVPGVNAVTDAFLVQPYARQQGRKVEKGNVRLFYSSDSHRVPLYGNIRAPVFTSVTMALKRRQ